VTVEDCDAPRIRSAFEKLASLVPAERFEWTANIARTHIEHYLTVFSYVRNLRDKHGLSTALDVGAVPGFISVTLQNSGLTTQAVDIDVSRTLRIFDSRGVIAHSVDIERERLPFGEATLDLVLFNEVIEHLRLNPILPLREIHRVLRPGGFMLLSTPNITLAKRLRFLWGVDFNDDLIKEFAKLETVGHMGHFRLYSKNEIERLLKYVGFQIQSARTHMVTKERRSWKGRLLEKLFPAQMGDHMYFVAQKN
jgi:2-polyprenyl-3-methyl-5-hydroxy-6-metoxy-1,4-benzoquinol methylase